MLNVETCQQIRCGLNSIILETSQQIDQASSEEHATITLSIINIIALRVANKDERNYVNSYIHRNAVGIQLSFLGILQRLHAAQEKKEKTQKKNMNVDLQDSSHYLKVGMDTYCLYTFSVVVICINQGNVNICPFIVKCFKARRVHVHIDKVDKKDRYNTSLGKDENEAKVAMEYANWVSVWWRIFKLWIIAIRLVIGLFSQYKKTWLSSSKQDRQEMIRVFHQSEAATVFYKQKENTYKILRPCPWIIAWTSKRKEERITRWKCGHWRHDLNIGHFAKIKKGTEFQQTGDKTVSETEIFGNLCVATKCNGQSNTFGETHSLEI
ncbi:hypothetical protein RFI_25861 [Reticulomyxa filosa]|uniref:Uncharacterized protein n=1 Tax=Reticulomyxa filosa TaxID=46433 RepID=X6MEN8_RETFI|nr:hypothetical protein RFI_25861 [Reticulomyxa filosa]|eukprot:ETO11515.1 hypothetical protein RFI_25861 [Reticulomyxa filosa]